MGNPSIIIGAGVLAVIIVYMFFKLGERDNKHFLLQLLLLFFIGGLLVITSKASMDDQDYCEWNIVNATDITNETTSFDYDYMCEENTNNTGMTLYKMTLWFIRLLAIYVFCYFVYEVLIFAGWVVPKT